MRQPDGTSRRDFIRTAAGMAAFATGGMSWTSLAAARPAAETPEALVKRFHESLKPEQKEKICFGWDHAKRLMVRNNWEIVPEQIGKFFTADQQAILKDVFKGVVSEDGYGRFQKQMKDDYNGFESYHVAVFGDPATPKFEWVLTGRHLTIRCDGNSQEGVAFGGPLFYGHAAGGDMEKPDHPGNVFWSQSLLANKVYQALDGKQQEKALQPKSPADDEKSIRIKKEGWTGLAVGEMSPDQKALVESAMKELLGMYRPSDVEEAMAFIKDGGGLEKVHVAFYKDGDTGDDKVWERWKLEGPAMSWYFRGSPHVHAWLNIGKA